MKHQPIALIAPTAEIVEKAKQVTQEYGIQEKVSFHVANMKRAVSLARQLEKKGTKIFIGRGATGELIQKDLSSPTVLIPILLQDIDEALQQAKKMTGLDNPKIAYFVSSSYREQIESIRDVLGIDIRLYSFIPDEEYIEMLIERVIADKVDIVLAGAKLVAAANRRNFPCVNIDSCIIAIKSAIQEANRLLEYKSNEYILDNKIDILIKSINIGAIIIDNELKILKYNKIASNLLKHISINRNSNINSIIKGVNIDGIPTSTHVKNIRIDGNLIELSIVPTIKCNSMGGAVIFVSQPGPNIPNENIPRQNSKKDLFPSKYKFTDILGTSPAIMEARRIAERYAKSHGNILIIGETGTGKEMFANAIHHECLGRQGPFVAVNCAALPATLLESELFGYDGGAFTGALPQGKQGLFELANGGCLFLDEITEMDNASQTRLLRVLQEGTIIHVGGTRPIEVHVRVLAACNQNIWKLVKEDKFRLDLFYRLNVLSLFLPPLRERREDIPLLAKEFLKRLCHKYNRKMSWGKEALTFMAQQEWQGNIRELYNFCEQAVAISEQDVLGLAEMNLLTRTICKWKTLHYTGQNPDSVDLSDRKRVLDALEHCQWHKGKAAALLGVDRSTLYRKMKLYEI